MLFTDLFQQLKKLGQTLTDDIGIPANGHKICIAVPPRHHVDVQVARQARTGASPEIHTDIKAVGFYRKRQRLLRLPD